MITKQLVENGRLWLGPYGISFFSHLKGLTGDVSPVLRLNIERKHIPTHPVHFREGMGVRNWMRTQDECKNWSDEDFDNNWIILIEEIIKNG
jgi:hypothetical protein